jgi:hypothetical protein
MNGMTETAERRRPPSIIGLATLPRVPYQTVSRVLNGHPNLRPATRPAVLGAIEPELVIRKSTGPCRS